MANQLWRNFLRQFRRKLANATMFLAVVAHVEAQGRSVFLRRGQVVPLEAMQEITSKTTHPGDKVPLRVMRDLVADGVTVLPAGSILYGRITAAHPAGKNCHDGRLDWKLESITLANGQNVRTQFSPVFISSLEPIPERVSLPSADSKIGNGVAKGAEMTGLSAFVVASSPLLVPMAIAMTEPCRGRPGNERVIHQEDHFCLAISKTTKITR